MDVQSIPNLEISKDKIAAFCQRHHIHKLSLFGSVLRQDFNVDSDIDILVEFMPGHIPGLIRFAGMELELSRIFNRKVDLRTAEDISPYFRQEVITSAVKQYVYS